MVVTIVAISFCYCSLVVIAIITRVLYWLPAFYSTLQLLCDIHFGEAL